MALLDWLSDNWKDLLPFIGSIISGLIAGLFTFLGVKRTLKYEREREIREATAKAKKEKPRLEIVDYHGFDETKNIQEINGDGNAVVLGIMDFKDDNGRARFYYDKRALEYKNLCFVEYELKNTGLTEIDEIYLTSNLPKNMSVIKLEESNFCIQQNFLCYDAPMNKRNIKPGDTLKIRIYYISNQIIRSNIGGAILSVWLVDTNNRYWIQSLRAPEKEISNSDLCSVKIFRESIDITTAIKCFTGELPW